MTTGYSGTPLAKKLGIKDGFAVLGINPPDNFNEIIAPLPDGVTILVKPRSEMDLIHLFTNSRDELFSKLAECVRLIKQNGSIWVSWYKKQRNCQPRSTKTRFAKLPFRLVLSTSRSAPLTKNGRG